MSQRDELEFQGGAATKPEASMETPVERIVIMPATVGQRRKNLQLFSVLRSFEQAQVKRIDPLFDFERTITGRSAGIGWPTARKRARPLLAS
jgi:hypothetical protein